MEAVCLIMGFFVPPIAFILLQDTMNRILKAHANIHQEETLQTTPAQELPERIPAQVIADAQKASEGLLLRKVARSQEIFPP